MYDIEGKLRRRAMLERLEGLGRADEATSNAVAIPVPDQSPGPRHRNDPVAEAPDDGLSPLHDDLSRRFRTAGPDDESAEVAPVAATVPPLPAPVPLPLPLPVPVPVPVPLPVPDQLSPVTGREVQVPHREAGGHRLVAEPYLEASPYVEPSLYADARPYTQPRQYAETLPKINGHTTAIHHPGLEPLDAATLVTRPVQVPAALVVPTIVAPLDGLPVDEPSVDEAPLEIISSAATIADLLRHGANKLFFAAGPPPSAPSALTPPEPSPTPTPTQD